MNRNIKIRQLTNEPYFSFENFMFSNLTRLTTENKNCQICKRDTNSAYIYKDVTFYTHYECLSLYFLYQFFRVTKSSTENSSGIDDSATSDKEEELSEDDNSPASNTSSNTPNYTSLYSIYGLNVDEIVSKERVDEDGEERVCHSCGIGEVYFKCLVDGCDNYLHITCSGSGNMVVYTNPIVNLNFYTALRNKFVDGSPANQNANSSPNMPNGTNNHNNNNNQPNQNQLIIKDQHEKDLVLDSYLRKNIINVKEKLISYRFLLCYGHINLDIINNIKAYFLYKLMVVNEYKHLYSVINVISSHMSSGHNTKPKDERKEDKRSSTNKGYLYKTQGSNVGGFNTAGSNSFSTMNSGYTSSLSTRNRSELMMDNEQITPEGFVPKREQGMLRREQEMARREEGRRNVLLINNLIYEYNLYRRSHIQRTNKPLNTTNFNILFQPVTNTSVTTPTGISVLGIRDDEVLEKDIRLLLNVNNNVNSVHELKKITLSNEFNIQNILNTMKQLMYPTPSNSTNGGNTGETNMDSSTPDSSTLTNVGNELREKDVYRLVSKRPRFVLIKLYNKFIWMSVTKLTNICGSKNSLNNINRDNNSNTYGNNRGDSNNTNNNNTNYNNYNKSTGGLLQNMEVNNKFNGVNSTSNMGSKMLQISDKGYTEDTKLVILDYIVLSNLEFVYIKNIVNSMYYYNNNAVLLLLNRALVRKRIASKSNHKLDNNNSRDRDKDGKSNLDNKESSNRNNKEHRNISSKDKEENKMDKEKAEKEEKERRNKDKDSISNKKDNKEEVKDEVINLCGYSWDINPPLYKLYKMQHKPRHGNTSGHGTDSQIYFIKDLVDKQLGGKEEKEETFVYKQSIALLSALNSINNNIENYKKNIESNILKDQYKYENLCFNNNFVSFFQNVSTSLHRYNHFKQSIRKSILFYNPDNNVNNISILIDNSNNGGDNSFGLGKISTAEDINNSNNNNVSKRHKQINNNSPGDNNNKYENKENKNKDNKDNNNMNRIKEEGNKTKVDMNNSNNNNNNKELAEKNEGEEKVKISKEYCSVCLLSELSHKHVLLQCQKCYLRVHYKCYHNYLVQLGGTTPNTTNSTPNATASNSTVSNRPSTDTNTSNNNNNKDNSNKLGFYCDPCSIEYNQRYETNYNSAICISCLSSGGAMKSVHLPTNTFTMNPISPAIRNQKNKDKGDEEKWIHLICLVFIMPKVVCYDFNNLSQWCIPFNYNAMSTCSICGVVGGIQVSCCYDGGCNNNYNNDKYDNKENKEKDSSRDNGLGIGVLYNGINNNNMTNGTNNYNNNGIQMNGMYNIENNRMLGNGIQEVNMNNGNQMNGVYNQEKGQSECKCELKFHPMCCLLSGCYIKYSEKNALNMNQYHLRTYINNFFNGVFNKESFNTSKEMMNNWEDGVLNNLFQSILLEPLCMKHTAQLYGDKFLGEQTVKRCFAYTHYLYNPDGFKSKKKYNSLPIEPIYSPVTITRNGPIKSQPRIMPQHYTKKFSFDPLSKRVKYNEPYLISVIYGLPKNMCGDVPKYGITAITNYLSSAKNNNLNSNNHLNNSNKDNNNKDFKEFKGIHDDKLWYSKHPPQYMVNK